MFNMRQKGILTESLLKATYMPMCKENSIKETITIFSPS